MLFLKDELDEPDVESRNCPARSLDLAPLHFFLCQTIKDNIKDRIWQAFTFINNSQQNK